MATHIKKINNLKSFCGLDNILQSDEFTDYNVIFANNGVGKTTATRAFELLIKKNNHILKYQTIDSIIKPEISFLLNDNTIINIDETTQTLNAPFKLEIYNSDFLSNNAPFGGEFGLKKLDDQTIILEGSAIGEETKEIEQLKLDIEKTRVREKIINGDINAPDNLGEIKKFKNQNVEVDKKIESIRKDLTSNLIQISIDDITIHENFSDELKFHYDDKKLVELQQQCDGLNEALKKFDLLDEIKFPIFNFNTQKKVIDELFLFDKEKEAGLVSENIKTHILKVGTKFLQEGIQIVEEKELDECPFCKQLITNGILDEYASYFNEKIKQFDSTTLKISKDLNADKENLKNEQKNIIEKFEKYKPFLNNQFEENKNNLNDFISNLVNKITELSKLILLKEGIAKQHLYTEILTEIDSVVQKIESIIKLTKSVLEDKKAQKSNLEQLKKDLKSLKILKGKKESLGLQKSKFLNSENISKLKNESIENINILKEFETKLQKLQAEKRPEIEVINGYLKVLNLSKYSINKDYQITINAAIVENDNLKIVLSEGEKTTITFAYFMARLKAYYNEVTLKNLVIVIDDPISSLDENRIYNTSYLVSKVNQEIAGKIVKESKDKAQVFVFTHSHIFMTNIIRILGKHVSYFQLTRNNSELEFHMKDKVAGYFDTFFLLLFKEVYQFANTVHIIEDYNKALNNGNKIRIMLESFMKTNFISEFIEKEFKQQSSFDEETINTIIKKIKIFNSSHLFANSIFKDIDCVIIDEKNIFPKIDLIVKGLHMDSHGSIVDFYSQHKTSLSEVHKFAKIAINIMIALNPNQVHFYIEAAQ